MVPKMVVVPFRATNVLKLARWQRSDHFGREEPRVFSAGSTSTKPPSNGSDFRLSPLPGVLSLTADVSITRGEPDILGFC
jgi:hypothetical protein